MTDEAISPTDSLDANPSWTTAPHALAPVEELNSDRCASDSRMASAREAATGVSASLQATGFAMLRPLEHKRGL
jgi:hypothetical protein